MKSPMGYGFVPWEGMFFISPQGTRGRSYSAPPMGRVDREERFQGVKLRKKMLVFFDKDQSYAVFLPGLFLQEILGRIKGWPQLGFGQGAERADASP